MLKYLFPRDWPRYASGSHGALVRDFASWIVERGYTRICAKRHVRRFRQVLNQNRGVLSVDRPITPAALTRWFAAWADDALYCATRRAAECFLSSQRLLITTAKPGRFDALISEYHSHLVDLRGLSPSTVKQHVETVAGFLVKACRNAEGLTSIAAEDIEHFINQVSNRLSRQSLQHTVAHLRAFLKFCADRGYTRKRLDVIDTPRTYRSELPPRALRWIVVRTLLRSIERSSVAGCRDYAILYLMAHYGLRPSEVAHISVDSIDWETGLLRVEQCKTRSTLLLPLSDHALGVLRRYLRRRPEAPWRELFLRVRCPAGPIKGATIDDIYAKRARLSGLSIEWSSPYSLRHSFAMRLLERGVGVKAIGDLLGHRSLESTCVYLRLHMQALRQVALALPRARNASLNRRPT
jgi:integrase/recombinase XerD